MKLTTSDLKVKKYGTGCGDAGSYTYRRKECLSNKIIIDFIDEYFNGEFYDVEIEDDELLSGEAIFSKTDLSSNFFNIYIKFLADIENKSVDDFFNDYCNDWDIFKLPNGDFDIEDKKILITTIFSNILSELGGSLRVDPYDDNLIEIETE